MLLIFFWIISTVDSLCIPQVFFKFFLMDWKNHNCYHEEAPSPPRKPKYIIFICLKTYVYTVVQETVMVWLSHIQGTNRMMVFGPGSANKPKLPKVRLKLQEKRERVLPSFFFFFWRGKCTEMVSFYWLHTVSSLHALCFLFQHSCARNILAFRPEGQGLKDNIKT